MLRAFGWSNLPQIQEELRRSGVIDLGTPKRDPIESTLVFIERSDLIANLGGCDLGEPEIYSVWAKLSGISYDLGSELV